MSQIDTKTQAAANHAVSNFRTSHRPHFETVRTEMARMLLDGSFYLGPDLTMAQALQAVYDKAVSALPQSAVQHTRNEWAAIIAGEQTNVKMTRAEYEAQYMGRATLYGLNPGTQALADAERNHLQSLAGQQNLGNQIS